MSALRSRSRATAARFVVVLPNSTVYCSNCSPFRTTPTSDPSVRSRRHASSSSSTTPRRQTKLGRTSPLPNTAPTLSTPYRFETGYALFAKRASRPFPPPFTSPPSGSFSDPLSTHHKSRIRGPSVQGEMIRGVTNGDDAVLVERNFVAANDGVGAWSTRPRGHAALWSRLILHFWALEVQKAILASSSTSDAPPLDPISYLQRAYEQTQAVTTSPEVHGTTTACGAILHHQPAAADNAATSDNPPTPLLHVTNLGDSQILVLRPSTGAVLYKTAEQWHWFDCPRQLGTNSPDRPSVDAVCDAVPLEVGDVVVAMSDGVPDNLWEHEIVANVLESVAKVKEGREGGAGGEGEGEVEGEGKQAAVVETASGQKEGGMMFVADQLLKAARSIAEDPFAESPFMERAIEEGLAMEGGKLDDISVVIAMCQKSED